MRVQSTNTQKRTPQSPQLTQKMPEAVVLMPVLQVAGGINLQSSRWSLKRGNYMQDLGRPKFRATGICQGGR